MEASSALVDFLAFAGNVGLPPAYKILRKREAREVRSVLRPEAVAHAHIADIDPRRLSSRDRLSAQCVCLETKFGLGFVAQLA